jgi:hypothetical protein
MEQKATTKKIHTKDGYNMQVIQTHLSRPTYEGTAHMITWLPVHPKIKPGAIISLDKDPDRWRVEQTFQTTDLENIQTRWGLDLPKSQRTER